MVTSEWGTPNMVKNGLIPELLLGGKRSTRYLKPAAAYGQLEVLSTSGRPHWDAKQFAGTLKALPERSDLPSDINESLIVELYSK